VVVVVVGASVVVVVVGASVVVVVVDGGGPDICNVISTSSPSEKAVNPLTYDINVARAVCEGSS
jgi:hypothetical protein